jgi:hypothetical protein
MPVAEAAISPRRPRSLGSDHHPLEAANGLALAIAESGVATLDRAGRGYEAGGAAGKAIVSAPAEDDRAARAATVDADTSVDELGAGVAAAREIRVDLALEVVKTLGLLAILVGPLLAGVVAVAAPGPRTALGR